MMTRKAKAAYTITRLCRLIKNLMVFVMSLTQDIGTEKSKEPMHVDAFIDHGTNTGADNEEYARWMMNHFRLPATLSFAFEQFMTEHKLFCTHKGMRYRVTGASRMGDVWLANDFNQTTGYDWRVLVEECTEWDKAPK